jgi:ankyrin repeat protein
VTSLPPRASLEWLRKTAKDRLRNLRLSQPAAKLADAQLALAREHGFRSWRALKAHVDALGAATADPPAPPAPSPDRDAEVRQFFRLAATGSVDDVRARLDADPALAHAVGPHPFWGGRPQALHVVIESDRGETFDLLLSRGASVDGDNDAYGDWSPLMLAAQRGRTRMRAALLARGARVGVAEALLLGDDGRLSALLAAGADALPARVPNGGSPLVFARTPFAVERLLALGVPAETRDQWGTSPVEAFSRLGEAGTALVAMLIARGVAAPPDVHARLGDLAALQAAVAQAPAIVQHGAVLIAAVDGRRHDVVSWLLAHGASANARAPAESKQTALHSAAWNGDLQMAKLLVEAGADVAARDEEHDSTPRGWAETSLEITRNPAAGLVAAYLASVGG